MALLVNKMNREVKVIIPNMREFRVFYSDNEGSVMFFKRDWQEVKSEESWKPSEEQMKVFDGLYHNYILDKNDYKVLESLYEQLKKL